MKCLPVFLLLLLLCFTSASAQKDAPVAGHSATLVDLLKKDYNTIDPELRGDEIIKDRALVIAIFKTYLTDQEKSKIKHDSLGILSKEAAVRMAALDICKKKLASIASVTSGSMTVKFLDSLTMLTENLNAEIDAAKIKYLESKLKLDLRELKVIEDSIGKENVFLKYAIASYARKYYEIADQGVDPFSASSNTSSIQKSIPFIGGDLAFETVIDGLGRFLAKRIKEELTTYVIERVKVWLENPREDDPFAEFKVLLPRTTQYLLGFHAEKITSFPDEIKQYIEDDLNHLLENAGALNNTPRIRRLIDKNPDIDFAFEALTLIPDLSKLRNPVDFFKTIENSRNLNRWKQEPGNPVKFNIANLVQLSSMIGQSMTIVENGDVRFAGKDFFGTYAAEQHFYLLYMGFLNQQHKKYYDIHFTIKGKTKTGESACNYSMGAALSSVVGREPGKKDLFRERKFFTFLLSELGENAEKVIVSATEIRKANKAGVKIGADTVYHFVDSMIELSEKVIEASDTLVNYLITAFPPSEAYAYPLRELSFESFKLLELRKLAKPYFVVARTANDVALDLQKKKYANALTKALELGASLTPQSAVSEVRSNVFKLGFMNQFEKFKYWNKITDSVLQNQEAGAFKVNESMIKSAGVVLEELYRIRLFYKANFDTTPQMSSLDVLEGFVDNITKTSVNRTFTNADFNAVATTLGGSDFACLLVAYYVNVPVSTLVDHVVSEMRAAQFKLKSGTENKLFGEKEILQMKTSIGDYAFAIYDNYVLKGYKNEGNELLAARKQLTTRLNNYLALLPSRANIAIDPRVTSLLHFVNDMAAAEDAEDVEKAIEAFALPAGSYTIKRTALFNFSVNSYPGIMPGGERSWKNESTETKSISNAFTVGFTAPVGLSASRGLLKGNSIGVFIPIIDIGAVTRLRLDNNSATSALPEFKLKNFFSPGLFFHYGFRNTPLAINVGGQFGPEVKRIKVNEEPTFFESVRFGAALVIDIPLFNLYTKPRFDD